MESVGHSYRSFIDRHLEGSHPILFQNSILHNSNFLRSIHLLIMPLNKLPRRPVPHITRQYQQLLSM